MPSDIDQKVGEIVRAMGVTTAGRIDELLKTLPETGSKTLAEALVEEKFLDENQARKIHASAQEALAAPSIPGYSLLGKLGQGGMGAVYKAVQSSMGRIVALKLLPTHLAENKLYVERFYREARSSARLDHPNVVRGYDVGESGGVHFFAMEFVDGQSVGDLLDKHKRFSVADALKITLDIAKALEHAQEFNIVHRDIKPDNIMVTRKGVVKLADLGLAKQTDDDHAVTQTGSGFGTPYYMAPEQARNAKHVDGRSDLYALGVTLYRLLTGEVPFSGETAMEVLIAKDKGIFKKASSLNPDVPPRVNLLVDKMMAKEPGQRHQTAKELIAEIESLALAGDELSFIQGAPAARAAPTTTLKTQRTTSMPKPAGGATRVDPKEKKNAPKERPVKQNSSSSEPDLWFLRYKDYSGKIVKTKAYTARVRKMLQEGNFDDSVEASRSPDGPFKKLQFYIEFQDALQSTLARKSVDKKNAAVVSKMADLVDNFDEAQARHKRKQKLGSLGVVVWSIALTVVILGGGGWLLYTFVLAPGFENTQRENQALQEKIRREKEARTPVKAAPQ